MLRKEPESGLANIGDCVDESVRGREECTIKSQERLITAVGNNKRHI